MWFYVRGIEYVWRRMKILNAAENDLLWIFYPEVEKDVLIVGLTGDLLLNEQKIVFMVGGT